LSFTKKWWSRTMERPLISSPASMPFCDSQTCHELRLLDLSQCKDASSAALICPFHIEFLQSRLPKLRVLRMAGVSVSGLEAQGEGEEEGGESVDATRGFSHLRELSLASSPQHISATLASAPALNR
jgi:hypothetical protein